jgi:integrase
MLIQQEVGNAVAEWHESEPLQWVMREVKGKGKDRREQVVELELASLREAYAETFLLAVKEVMIQERHRVQLRTIDTKIVATRNLLRISHEKGIVSHVVERIDGDFLRGLSERQDVVPASYLKELRALFMAHRGNEALFAPDLRPGDFSVRADKRGLVGSRKHKILSAALTRGQLARILDVVEAAHEEGELDLARYSFIRLALHVYGRPASYLELRCRHLRVDTNPATGTTSHFIDLPLPKTRAHTKPRAAIKLNADVGGLLEKQREAVVRDYAWLVKDESQATSLAACGDLPLFPAVSARRVKQKAKSLGGISTSSGFKGSYLEPIRELTVTKLTFNALRHTVATQLALMGSSKTTIAGVLKHSTETTAKVYVDIFFEGLLDQLSGSMEPAFEEHYPVFDVMQSKLDAIPLQRRITSDDMETMRTEVTGECGRTVACDYAPVACYTCKRFIPCYDADHSINLTVVEREIEHAEGYGLPMRSELAKYKHAANAIRVVIAICETRKTAVEERRAAEGETA